MSESLANRESTGLLGSPTNPADLSGSWSLEASAVRCPSCGDAAPAGSTRRGAEIDGYNPGPYSKTSAASSRRAAPSTRHEDNQCREPPDSCFHIPEYGIHYTNGEGRQTLHIPEYGIPMKPLRPQDIYVLLALAARCSEEKWTYDELALQLDLSSSQIYRSLERAQSSHLFDKNSRRIRRPELLEFLGYGIRYAFPARPGQIQRGFPTCWEAPEVPKPVSFSTDEQYVWPAPSGSHRGQAIEPLHSSVLIAAGNNLDLYRLLALTDVLRVGSARERDAARDVLDEFVL